MKNEMVKADEYEDEIDLVDLIKILIRNKGIILLTTIIITAISIGAVFYLKANRVEKYSRSIILKNDVDIDFNINSFLYNNEILDKFFFNPTIKKLYNESVTINKENYLTKRKFLNNIITFKVNEKTREITITTEVKDKEQSMKIMELYFDLLNKSRIEQIKSALGNKENLKAKVEFYKNNLEKIKKEIANYISTLPRQELDGKSIIEIVELMRPMLMTNKKEQESYYKKYNSKLMSLEDVTSSKSQIILTSSIYQVEEKSKSLMILAIGMILGLFLGIFIAFMKEFFSTVDWKDEKTIDKK